MAEKKNKNIYTELHYDLFWQFADELGNPREEGREIMDEAFTMLVDELRRWRQRYYLAKHFEEMAKKLRTQNSEIEQPLLDRFADTGLEQVSFKGGGGIKPDRKLWVKKLTDDQKELVSVLKQAGLPELVQEENLLSQRASAWVRELDRQGKPIPKELEDYLGVSEVLSLKPLK